MTLDVKLLSSEELVKLAIKVERKHRAAMARQRVNRAKLKANGLCRDCGIAIMRYSQCDKCRAKAAKAKREWRVRHKAQDPGSQTPGGAQTS